MIKRDVHLLRLTWKVFTDLYLAISFRMLFNKKYAAISDEEIYIIMQLWKNIPVL